MDFQSFKNIVENHKVPVNIVTRDLYVIGQAFIDGGMIECEVDTGDNDYNDLLALAATSYKISDGQGSKIHTLKKPLVSGTKIKSHDFSKPETWYGKSIRKTINLGQDLAAGLYTIPTAVDVNSPALPFGMELQGYEVVVTDQNQTLTPTIQNSQISLPDMVGSVDLTYSEPTTAEFEFVAGSDCIIIDATVIVEQTIPDYPKLQFSVTSGSNTVISKTYNNAIDYLSESDLSEFNTIPAFAGAPAFYCLRWDYRQPIPLSQGMSLTLSPIETVLGQAWVCFSVQFF